MQTPFRIFSDIAGGSAGGGSSGKGGGGLFSNTLNLAGDLVTVSILAFDGKISRKCNW